MGFDSFFLWLGRLLLDFSSWDLNAVVIEKATLGVLRLLCMEAVEPSRCSTRNVGSFLLAADIAAAALTVSRRDCGRGGGVCMSCICAFCIGGRRELVIGEVNSDCKGDPPLLLCG